MTSDEMMTQEEREVHARNKEIFRDSTKVSPAVLALGLGTSIAIIDKHLAPSQNPQQTDTARHAALDPSHGGTGVGFASLPSVEATTASDAVEAAQAELARIGQEMGDYGPTGASDAGQEGRV